MVGEIGAVAQQFAHNEIGRTQMADEPENTGETLKFQCSNCGFEAKSGNWFGVSQHIKLSAECSEKKARVLTITLDKNGDPVTRQETPMGIKPAPLEPEAATHQPSMAERFAAQGLSLQPRPLNMEVDDEDEEYPQENPDDEYDPRSKRVSIGRTAVPELPAWVIATYEAFCASGYPFSLSRFLEEAVALDLIFTGVNVQILPYSALERQQVMERVGAIAQEVA